MRALTVFPCEGETLAGTLDAANGTTGLLIVSGGSEIRIGAHRGMALLAGRVAAAGYPVLRFDRRGVGDSTGPNGGYASSAADIAAAAAHLRAVQPALRRVVGFGNCDAATALALYGPAAGIDGFVLANPWTIEDEDDLPPPAAIRARYAAKLRSPRELWRLVSGGVDLTKLVRGLRRAGVRPTGGLAQRLAAAVPGDATILTAAGDNTAIAFRVALPDAAVIERTTASHSFAGPGDADWLFAQVLAKLRD